MPGRKHCSVKNVDVRVVVEAGAPVLLADLAQGLRPARAAAGEGRQQVRLAPGLAQFPAMRRVSARLAQSAGAGLAAGVRIEATTAWIAASSRPLTATFAPLAARAGTSPPDAARAAGHQRDLAAQVGIVGDRGWKGRHGLRSGVGKDAA